MIRSGAALALCSALMACHHGGGSAPPGGTVEVQFPSPPGGPAVPAVPLLTGVQTAADGSRLSVTFQPVAGAKDYRIFPLPAAADVAVDGSGLVSVKNAVYRCAGARFAIRAVPDASPSQDNGWVTAIVTGKVEDLARTAADAILGYAFIDAGAGRVPVYALGDPAPDADNECGGEIWAASRVKRYTASDSERASLIAAGFRDDGIAFYAPAAGAAQVSTGVVGESRLYATGAESVARTGFAPAFTLLAATAAGAVPVYRVYYKNGCGKSHDELAAGQGWFERIATQGNQPVFEVQWPALAKEITFVVEALDTGCPFQGHLGPAHVAAAGNAETVVTVDEVRAASPTGEVFVNGQHGPAGKPKAIARAFVKMAPAASPPMDWAAGFSTGTAGPVFTQASLDTHGYWDLRLTAPGYDAQFYAIEPETSAVGVVQGELWVAYADWGSDTNGKFRLTPQQRATLSASSFVHATMTADLWSTGRRYPQLILSDVPPPVQEHLETGTTLIAQTRGHWPFDLELQLCDHRTWDVNNQCPGFRIEMIPDVAEGPWPPHVLPGELAAPGQLKRIDLYASTKRAYLFLDGKPYGCANLTAAPAAGPATVTFGDVLYHSGVDEPVVAQPTYYQFLRQHLFTQALRHFDNLAFSSGVAAPEWNESLFPCTSTLDSN